MTASNPLTFAEKLELIFTGVTLTEKTIKEILPIIAPSFIAARYSINKNNSQQGDTEYSKSGNVLKSQTAHTNDADLLAQAVKEICPNTPQDILRFDVIDKEIALRYGELKSHALLDKFENMLNSTYSWVTPCTSGELWEHIFEDFKEFKKEIKKELSNG